MKAIQLLLNSELPPDLRDYTRELDSKSIGALMTDVARKYPDQYERISKVISDFGRKASYFQGETLNLNDTRPVIDKDLLFKAMDAEIDEARKSTKNDEEFKKLRLSIWDKYNSKLEKDTGKAALEQGNNLGYTVVSGARGKLPQLKMMLTTPGLYTDADDNVIPMFIRNSFSEGLRPAEYMASTYGARKSVLCLAINTQVRMADGSIRNIQDINIGEYVLGSDKEGNTFPTQVINTFEQGQKHVYELLLTKRSSVVCTLEHKFLVNKANKFKVAPARSILCNDSIVGTGAEGPVDIPLLYIRPAGQAPCYDIEVEHEDHLFVLANGVVTSNSTKRATAKGGDLGKQMAQTAVNILVSENNCGVTNGIDLDINDKSLRGRVLAVAADGMPAGTVLDKDALSQLKKNKVNTLIVRSPMTCQAKEGVCAKCMGLNAQGKFPHKGEAVGITAGQAISEPITQMALNVKHQSGAASTGKREWSGFDYINQFVQSPETFPDKAILAKEDGQVTKITEAPQGGYYVNVNNVPHYVAPGYPLMVKVGDKLEAGDELSEGLADPGEIVDLKGLGEGRKYYANKLKELLDNSGMEADRRNTEMMARAALDHLQITDVKDGDQYLPDDVVSYSYFSNNYVPPKNTVRTPLNKASGQYLQAPTLHYTIGTKITPKITQHLSKVGFNEIYTSPDNPSFKPHMVRLRTASHQGNDWLAAMHTSYLKKQLSDSAIRGDSTNIESNTHFAPRLAIGVNFGDNIEQTGKF